MTRLVVIGGNAAGMSAASKAKRRDPSISVTVLEAGPHISYSSCGIPSLVSGIVGEPDDLFVLSREDATSRGIEVQTQTRALAFNPYTKGVAVQTAKGRDEVAYDKLVIATGSMAMNPFPGADLKGVHTIRHVGDGARLLERVKGKRKRVVVVGGGHTGLEMSEALQKGGHVVHLVQRSKNLLSSMDPDMTEGLDAWLGRQGVKVHTGLQVKGFEAGKDGEVATVEAKGGSFEADAVVVAAGLEPATAFAIKAGVQTLKSGHILVDDQMRTNLHDVWAAGDCAAPRHIVTGKPTPAPYALPSNRMGRVAGDSVAASIPKVPASASFFPGVLGTCVMRLYELAFAQTGLTERQAKEEGFDYETALVEGHDRAPYLPDGGDMAVKMVAEADTGKLLGVQLAGPRQAGLRINAAAVALHAGMTVKKFSEVETAYSPSFSPVWDPMVVCAAELSKKIRK